MRSFQIKDLTVTLNTNSINATQTIYCQWGCTHHFSHHCHYGCSIFVTHVTCYHGCSIVISCPTATCNPTFIDRTPTILKQTTTPIEAGLVDLSKAELEEMRSSLDDLQRKVDTQIRQTPEDLDLLESRLKEALEEVNKQRQNKG